jgi:hypothetical protein
MGMGDLLKGKFHRKGAKGAKRISNFRLSEKLKKIIILSVLCAFAVNIFYCVFITTILRFVKPL